MHIQCYFGIFSPDFSHRMGIRRQKYDKNLLEISQNLHGL